VSPEHLNRLYRRYGGIRAHVAIARARLTTAAERLLATDASLSTIAAESGYADAFSFSRAFRRVMGMPPSRWRREAR
jgi:AraC-like DNA-binding protein